MRRIFDCFTFFNELEILELRFEEMYENVDHFVLVEANRTFQGEEKSLIYLENKSRFLRFNDKIIHVIVDDMPISDNPWDLEHFQRNAIRRVFDRLTPNDVVIITDVDEIISRQTLKILRKLDGYFQLNMPMYQYYFNFRESINGWDKAFAFSFDLIDKVRDFNEIRDNTKTSFHSFSGNNISLNNSGWHFTYMGGASSIREKLNAYSHGREDWPEKLKKPGGVELQITAGFAVGNEWHLNEYVPIDESFPKFVIDNKTKYEQLNLVKNLYIALKEQQSLIRDLYHRSV